MNFSKILIYTSLLIIVTSTGCGGGSTNVATNTNTTNATANANTAKPANTGGITTTKTPEVATTNDAPTIKPVVMAYYEALKKKDDAGLRKVYSKDTLASLEKDMKEEGAKSLAQFLSELEPAPDQPFEVRNEQVQGDVIIAEIRGGAYPNGIRIKFIKENGEWKMTNQSPEFTSVKESANNPSK